MAELSGGSRARGRWIVIGGAAVALLAGLLIAMLLLRKPSGAPSASPASQGGLVVETGRDDDVKLDPKRPLRCFVGGQYVGELLLGDCARRNGVATGALDVGLDKSGALAAASGGGTDITPLPSSPSVPEGEQLRASVLPPQTAAPEQAYAQSGGLAEGYAGGCLRRQDGEWRPEPRARSMTACVQLLFDGVCLHSGEARFGRFGGQTLRLYEGRVAVASDGHNFRPLVDQEEDCSLPSPG